MHHTAAEGRGVAHSSVLHEQRATEAMAGLVVTCTARNSAAPKPSRDSFEVSALTRALPVETIAASLRRGSAPDAALATSPALAALPARLPLSSLLSELLALAWSKSNHEARC